MGSNWFFCAIHGCWKQIEEAMEPAGCFSILEVKRSPGEETIHGSWQVSRLDSENSLPMTEIAT